MSQKQIDIARSKSLANGFNIDFIKSDIKDLDLKQKFDVVTAGFVFSYAPICTELKDYLRVAYNHLKTDGRLFSVVCNPLNPLRESGVLYRVSLADGSPLKNGSKLCCEFFDRDGKFLCYDYKFFWDRTSIEDSAIKTGFNRLFWIDIKNRETSTDDVPKLKSTNAIFYARK